ncbi:MAG: DUF423 domain-containing protein [Chloroflexi bacterium]|jgi:uncharacterized membrane protein YgdD (TMEM256/DUF423 family)|nr:DUF423 domain-containing protein [Chloroflexota bacterium]
MSEAFFILGSLFGALGVAAGAFGAHGLRARLTPDRLDTFEVAVRYQMYHALALLAAAYAVERWPESSLPVAAGLLFLAGIVVFSGSLYALVLSGERRLGIITPLGGLAMVAGWALLALTVLTG